MKAEIALLSAPVAGASPAGVNIRTDSKARSLYFRLKDARNEARSDERGASPDDAMKLSPSWMEVSRLAIEALSTVTKDVEILAWLAEAQLRLEGFEGLGEVFQIMGDLFENYWKEIHSIGENDEDKVAPLVGLNGVSGEGSLIQPIRLCSLLPGTPFFQHSLWDFQVAQRKGQERGDFDDAMDSIGPVEMREYLDLVTRCISTFDRWNGILGEKCGEFAPPSSNTRNVLAEVAAAIRFLSGFGETDPAEEIIAEKDVVPVVNGGEAPVIRSRLPMPGEISSREEALQTLLTVARYFRQAEPHSPLSHSIETLVRRGRMDFVSLLEELLPEQQSRRLLLMTAGIKPDEEEQEK